MSLPSGVSSGLIKGRFIRAVIDGPDAGDEPDGVPIPNLNVTLRAMAGKQRLTHAQAHGATPPTVIFFDEISCTTNAEGVLVHNDRPSFRVVATDDPDVRPNGFTYEVTISTEISPTEIRFHIAVPSGGEVDLAQVMPVPDKPAADVLEWLAVRAEVLAAAGDIPTLAAAAAHDAIGAEVLGRSLVGRGERIVPTDESSAFSVAVGSDRVAFQVDAAGNSHFGGAAVAPADAFEWAVGERVALGVDAAGNTHIGDMAVVPSEALEFATADGRVHFSWNPNTGRVFIGSLEVGEWAEAALGGPPVGLLSFGDSMTYSQEGEGTTWPNELAALLCAPAVNYGRPAWGSGNVAMLAGATAPRVTVQGGQIPASGPVPVTMLPTDGWRKSGTGTLWLKVDIAGVTGSLEYNLASESWAFVRDVAGQTTPVPPNSPVRALTVDWSAGAGFDFTVQVGRNNASETSAILRDLAAFEVLALRRGVRMLTLGVSPIRGNATDLPLVVALNEQIAAAASAYFDVRGWLATASPETATSVTYAAGHPQTRFYAPDGVHFNALGYKTLARGLNLHMPSIGWS